MNNDLRLAALAWWQKHDMRVPSTMRGKNGGATIAANEDSLNNLLREAGMRGYLAGHAAGRKVGRAEMRLKILGRLFVLMPIETHWSGSDSSCLPSHPLCRAVAMVESLPDTPPEEHADADR